METNINPGAVSSQFMVAAYLVYLLVSITLTIWVARTLQRNGAPFLHEAFLGKEVLADSVNHLLVVGFYLMNIGFVALALKEHQTIWTLQEIIELVCAKIGKVLVMLGGMHFFNLYIFNRIRRSAMVRQMPPPVAPREFTRMPASAKAT
ncbi:hypothetical protein F0U62_20620 [Cystobacter fuscus]|uniref:hypothetical protein n=1 Tax=Cystobacter fuscus TaxID=43 RepID=UPI002B32229B|nr:hypothetical protein F0U62_20620 [Cystobacter fuscus]